MLLVTIAFVWVMFGCTTWWLARRRGVPVGARMFLFGVLWGPLAVAWCAFMPVHWIGGESKHPYKAPLGDRLNEDDDTFLR